MNISLGSYVVKVIIKYKKNKNIYFRFDDNLNLLVTCPKYTLNDEIIRLIKKNEESLIKMYEKALEHKKYDLDFYYLGKKYNVSIDDNIENVQINGEYIYAKDEEMLESFLKEEIDRIFKSEVEICSQCFASLPDFKIKTRKMKTRWGVCNRSKKEITLNTELIKKDIKLLDYVIIHELSHFYEGNHSKNFWNIVSTACPNYKELRKELRK